jgi:hypothetical protein
MVRGRRRRLNEMFFSYTFPVMLSVTRIGGGEGKSNCRKQP